MGYSILLWVWIVLAVLVALLGIRRLGVRRRYAEIDAAIDDDAVRRILMHGSLHTSDDEPLDEDDIARAESEFWNESWDEPEEFG